LECFNKANDCSCLPSTQSIVKGGQFCKALGFGCIRSAGLGK
jgi:hypothetical protein